MATKPKRRARLGVDEMAQVEFDREFEAVFETLAAEQGKPPGAKPVSDAKKLALWGQRDPNVDPDALAQMLMTTGVPPEIAAELALLQEHADNEELMMAYATPTDDPEMADMLARMAEMPFRTGFLLDITDPEERVKEAERLDARWQRQMGAVLDSPPAQVAPAQQPASQSYGENVSVMQPGSAQPQGGAVDVPAPPPGTAPQSALSMIGG